MDTAALCIKERIPMSDKVELTLSKNDVFLIELSVQRTLIRERQDDPESSKFQSDLRNLLAKIIEYADAIRVGDNVYDERTDLNTYSDSELKTLFLITMARIAKVGRSRGISAQDYTTLRLIHEILQERKSNDGRYAELIGYRIVEILTKKGWRQERLSQDSGIQKGRISEIVNGKANVTLSTIQAIEAALGEPIIKITE